MSRPGIFLTRYPEQLPQPLPPQIVHFSYAPLSQLLPHCAALVHHGGIGTCSQALRAGVPQLIQPFAFDQFDNGARIEKLGVGRTISKRSFRAKTLIQHLELRVEKKQVYDQRIWTLKDDDPPIDNEPGVRAAIAHSLHPYLAK